MKLKHSRERKEKWEAERAYKAKMKPIWQKEFDEQERKARTEGIQQELILEFSEEEKPKEMPPDNLPEVAKRLQQISRETMKVRLMADIIADIQVCEIEGYDKTEYLDDLINLLLDIKRKVEGE